MLQIEKHVLGPGRDRFCDPGSGTVGVVHQALETAARRFPDAVALRAGDASWSFGALDAAGASFSRHLVARGVRPGERVAVMTTSRPEFVMAVNGISRAGAAAVLLSPAWKEREVAAAMALTTPTHAVVDASSGGLLQSVLGERRVLDLDDPAALEAALAHETTPVSAPTGADAEAVLVFSSGTTGLPKAVRHTRSSLAHATRHWITALGLGPDDRFQVATPPSHILGLLNLLAAAQAGASVRLHRRFDLEEVLSCIERERMTLEMAVAPIALALAEHPAIEQRDLSSLRYWMWCATPVTASVAEVVTARTGIRWMTAYGASEVPVLACNPVHCPDDWRLDSVGLAPDGVDLRVVDLESGQVLPPGGVGELQARGPSCMAGYLPDSETGRSFDDGWYRTGDVGVLEAGGWVRITDRSKEMIKVKGFQVAPAEVESVLLGHPAVQDCAVFGVPDVRSGEVPVAAVSLTPGARVAPDELQALVARSLATYKQVREVLVVDAVPRSPSGKVLRRVLRDEFVGRAGSDPS
jgi:acyl-CoA synthetase (AMP-forming)/AMP-acid ligase II